MNEWIEIYFINNSNNIKWQYSSVHIFVKKKKKANIEVSTQLTCSVNTAAINIHDIL